MEVYVFILNLKKLFMNLISSNNIYKAFTKGNAWSKFKLLRKALYKENKRFDIKLLIRNMKELQKVSDHHWSLIILIFVNSLDKWQAKMDHSNN